MEYEMLNFRCAPLSVANAKSMIFLINGYHMGIVVRNPVFGVFDRVPHKLGCNAIIDG